jgi:peptide/nickel transport system substrate-binding protein
MSMTIDRRTFMGGLAAIAALSPLRMSLAAETGVLTVAQSYDPTSLWPNSTTAQEQINVGNAVVESLFWMDPKTKRTEPVLATGYDIVSPTQIRISLRPGVKFTNGEPMDADAVVHSINVFKDAKLTPGYARFALPIEKAEKQDAATVLMTMKFANPALDLLLSQIYITPPKYWAEVGLDKFGMQPVGTGPFILTEWVRDNRIVMDANPSYWGTKPEGIRRVIWRPVPDDTARSAGLMAGEFDVAANMPMVAAEQIKADNRLQLVAVPSYRIFMLALSSLEQHKGPLQDKRVRQAVNYAIDKQSIIDALFGGNARPLNGQMLRPEQMGYDTALKDYAYDPAKAKSLLAEAGFSGGVEIPFKFPSGRYVQDREVAEAIAGMLAEVGIRTRMIALEAGEFLRQLNSRELGPMAYMGLAPVDDPDAQISQFRSDWRYSFVANQRLDVLIDAGGKEMDKAKRAEIYRQAGQLMYEEASVAFLFQSIDLYGAARRVKGFQPRGDQRWSLVGVSLG